MKIKNLTPHPVNILDADNNEITHFESAGLVRLKMSVESVGSHAGIPLTKTVFGEPEGLPGVKAGTLLIVSQLIKSALPERTDLVVPADVVRDKTGNIIGCRSLGR